MLKKNSIIEIGAIKFDSETFDIIDRFSKLIYREKPINRSTTRLTGITTAMIYEDGELLDEVLRELDDFVGNDIIFAHNATFDKRFIRYNLEKLNIKHRHSYWIDTISIFKKYFPNLDNYKLSTLIEHFNLGEKEDHRGLSDSEHTLSLLKIIHNLDSYGICNEVLKSVKRNDNNYTSLLKKDNPYITSNQISVIKDLIFNLTDKNIFNDGDNLIIYFYNNNIWDVIAEIPLDFELESLKLISVENYDYLKGYLEGILCMNEYLDWKLVNFKEI